MQASAAGRDSAETLVLASGSLPDETGFQPWAAHLPSLPEIDLGGVWSPEAVLRREAKLGDAVVFYDEGSNWRGVGTAWAMAEQGEKVTIVTPQTFFGQEIARTAADGAARRRLAPLGVRFLTEHCLSRWHGNGVTVHNLLTGTKAVIPAAALVMATTYRTFDPFPGIFPGKITHRNGNCTAPRLAAYAFHEGHRLALSLLEADRK